MFSTELFHFFCILNAKTNKPYFVSQNVVEWVYLGPELLRDSLQLTLQQEIKTLHNKQQKDRNIRLKNK